VDDPIAEVGEGRLRGKGGDGVRRFLGVPYAAPPLGPLRWRPPGAPLPWSGVRDASSFGPIAPQPVFPGDPGVGAEPMSENCLALNVWAPDGARSLPVLVWLHGGAFYVGSGSAPLYDGAALARLGLVVVTLNYRLGRLGVFDHPALAAERDPAEPSVTYGLLDMAQALRWLRANLPAFGGDPGRITLMGESAGGAAVLRLMRWEAARGLFHRGVVLSGLGGERATALASLRARTAEMFPGDADSLRALPVEALLRPSPDFYGGDLLVRDGVVVPEDPADAFAGGRQVPMPLMLASTSREIGPVESDRAYGGLLRRLPAGWRERLETLYGTDPDARGALLGDLLFTEPARRFADLHARAGHPAWLARFDLHPGGTPHAGELPYIFGNLPPVASKGDRAVASDLAARLAAFARGEPPGPDWPAHVAGATAQMTFTPSGPRVAPISHRERLEAVAACRVAMSDQPGPWP